jgi:hypothetical protein
MKKINIQNEANIKAEGKLNNNHCKPVICVNNGKVFTSMTDAAEYAGVSGPTMVTHLQGKTRTCRGKHFCYLSKVTENLDSIVTRLRETAAVEEDAKRWQAYQAEQEAIRKAEEKRQAEIAKAAEKVAKLTASAQDLEAKWHKVMAELTEAEKILEAMQDNAKEVA